MKDEGLRERQAARLVASEHDRGPLVASIREHLQVYGYLPAEVDDCDPEQFCVHLRRAVSLFQTYFRLPVTGYVDVATLKLLTAKRCGMLDVPEDVARAAALGDEGVDGSDPFVFNFNSGPWTDSELTYAVYNGSPDLANEIDLIDEAVDIWEAQIPIRFRRITDRDDADIEVGFHTGAHGDGSPFDGRGNIAAHGFYPETGWLHFDEAETWVDWLAAVEALDPFDFSTIIPLLNGTDLLNAAIHEMGHVLGLDHSREQSAIMWPILQNGRHELSEHDIRGIKSIYPHPVRRNDLMSSVDLWAFAGGTGSVVVDLGTTRRFLAWGSATFVDPLQNYDRDNGVAVDIFTIDGDHPQRVGWGGDHLGSDGAPSNLFAGAVVGSGRRVQFRLSTFHNRDLEAYGTGCVVVLD